MLISLNKKAQLEQNKTPIEKKEVSIDDLIEIMVEKLNSGGTVTFTPRGTSMLPMLRDGEDIVVLSKPEGRLHLFDLPLYRRKDGTYVLHRVINFDSDRGYVMCGDNQFYNEHGVYDEDIIAVVTAFYRKGKAYTVDSLIYRIYIKFWHYTKPLRRPYRGAKRRVFGIFGKKGKKTNENKAE